MRCLHPYCPRGNGLASWADVVALAAMRVRTNEKPALLAMLSACGPLGSPAPSVQLVNTAAFRRLLFFCPCLYAQLPIRVSARGVVHLCEVTLGAKIQSANVYQAFQVQHPAIGTMPYLHPPLVSGAAGGDIMEALCSEVLDNHGVTHMEQGSDGWPVWKSCAHVSLNTGKMRPLKLYGDILVPCAPHNLLISVKSEAARERFVVSGNRLESVGFGFFSDASEFWTSSRMNLLKRWGFVAVYMPESTLVELQKHLLSVGTTNDAININGRPLFRGLADFGDDLFRIAGKLSLAI